MPREVRAVSKARVDGKLELNMLYFDGHEERFLRLEVKEFEVGGFPMICVSMDRKSRKGLTPLDVAKLDRVGVDFLNVKHWTYPFDIDAEDGKPHNPYGTTDGTE